MNFVERHSFRSVSGKSRNVGKVKCKQSEIMLFDAVRAAADEIVISQFNLYRDMDPGNWTLIEYNWLFHYKEA